MSICRNLTALYESNGAGEARVTITNRGVFIARFTTANREGWLKRLDAEMTEFGFSRGGLTIDNDNDKALVANVTRYFGD